MISWVCTNPAKSSFYVHAVHTLYSFFGPTFFSRLHPSPGKGVYRYSWGELLIWHDCARLWSLVSSSILFFFYWHWWRIPLRYNQFEHYFDKKNRIIYIVHSLLVFFTLKGRCRTLNMVELINLKKPTLTPSCAFTEMTFRRDTVSLSPLLVFLRSLRGR
jgi:hypothetical protein